MLSLKSATGFDVFDTRVRKLVGLVSTGVWLESNGVTDGTGSGEETTATAGCGSEGESEEAEESEDWAVFSVATGCAAFEGCG